MSDTIDIIHTDDGITARRNISGAWSVSTVVDGVRLRTYFIGHDLDEALALFRKAFL